MLSVAIKHRYARRAELVQILHTQCVVGAAAASRTRMATKARRSVLRQVTSHHQTGAAPRPGHATWQESLRDFATTPNAPDRPSMIDCVFAVSPSG
jgi:hypothetical protein